MAITHKLREDIECFLIEFMDQLDKTHINSEYMQEKFAKMSDFQFEQWLKKKYPLQLQVRAWEIEPKTQDYYDAAKVVGCNILEKIAEPFVYENEKGVPINTKETIIMRLNIKKMQQFITKKNKISIDIDDRNMKDGRLMTQDKGAAMSDKEQECLAIMGLNHTMDEFSTIKADAMNAKSEAYNQILTTGTLSEEDYKVEDSDSLARNMISAYMLSSHLYTNLVCKDGYTPYTLAERNNKTSRDSED